MYVEKRKKATKFYEIDKHNEGYVHFVFGMLMS